MMLPIHRRSAAIVVCLLLLPAALPGAKAQTRPGVGNVAIRLTNYSDGTVIRYPVPLICGELADAAVTKVTLTNAASQRPTRQVTGLAHKGRFKVLAELVPGDNKLVLKAGPHELPFNLTYKPQTNPYFVRIIWATDSSGDTTYQSPVPNDPQDYQAKLDTAMKLLQTFTAERLHDLGFGRATFNLELDGAGKVKVHTFKGAQPASFYCGLDGQAWWRTIGQEVGKPFPTSRAKNVVLAAYTRFDPATGKTRGHTALGGGSLGLFGSGDVFTWPSSLAEAQQVFMDATPIDSKKVFSDSVGRHTRWAAASTTLGATLHELSHTWGLPHTTEPMDIMTRGMDQLNRVFTLTEPPHARRPQSYEFPPDKVACFPPISAALLVTSRWLALDDRPWNDQNQIRISFDESGKQVLIESPHGVRFVGVRVVGNAVYHQSTPPSQPAPKQVRIALRDLVKYAKPEPMGLQAADDQGQRQYQDISAWMQTVMPTTRPATAPAPTRGK